MNQPAKSISTLHVVDCKVRRRRLLRAFAGKTLAISINSLAFVGKTPNGPMRDGNLAPGLTSNAFEVRHG